MPPFYWCRVVWSSSIKELTHGWSRAESWHLDWGGVVCQYDEYRGDHAREEDKQRNKQSKLLWAAESKIDLNKMTERREKTSEPKQSSICQTWWCLCHSRGIYDCQCCWSTSISWWKQHGLKKYTSVWTGWQLALSKSAKTISFLLLIIKTLLKKAF